MNETTTLCEHANFVQGYIQLEIVDAKSGRTIRPGGFVESVEEGLLRICRNCGACQWYGGEWSEPGTAIAKAAPEQD